MADHSRSITASTRIGKIAYCLEGDSGPLIAGFHGSPGSAAQISTIMDKMGLTPSVCRRLTIDRAGYNNTPLNSCRSMKDQSDLFAALLDMLNIETIEVIIAFSGGGIMALEFAKRHQQRVKKILLISAVTDSHSSYNNSWCAKLIWTVPVMNALVMTSYMFPKIAVKSIIAFLSNFRSVQLRQEYNNVIASPEDRDFLLQILRLNYSFKRLRSGLVNDTIEFLDANIDDYAELKLPILILHGACDPDVDIAHAEALCTRVESASLITIKDGYHLLMVGERFNSVKMNVFDFCKVTPP